MGKFQVRKEKELWKGRSIPSKTIVIIMKFKKCMKKIVMVVIMRRRKQVIVKSDHDKMTVMLWRWRKVYPRNSRWIALNSYGRSGGILLIWNSDMIEVDDFLEGIFFISISYRSIENNFRWDLIGVYGPCNVNEKKRFRMELATLHDYWDGMPLCFDGDFNENFLFPVLSTREIDRLTRRTRLTVFFSLRIGKIFFQI
ncbi:uncharacterized protein LOC113347733 isoform X1 [Papaver somniferum]|uniref:uncharacterized protein LOC113347733 isoform X1 n=1 Tax=Papaver somniferum TaxID=3469 RepID=UPI000E6F7240|nr:uncharacterized protein LOC113347733 isoform X1 [Papaver somniferum]